MENGQTNLNQMTNIDFDQLPVKTSMDVEDKTEESIKIQQQLQKDQQVLSKSKDDEDKDSSDGFSIEQKSSDNKPQVLEVDQVEKSAD